MASHLFNPLPHSKVDQPDVPPRHDSIRIDTQVQEGPVRAVELDWPRPCGAEVNFLGRTREQTHATFGPLQRLEYEVYQPMAERLLARMAEEEADRVGALAVRLVHARGAVAPGEASVVVQVATPHRSEAFDACRRLIDRIKHELPVWKHEVWARGRTFVEGCCAHAGSARREAPSPKTERTPGDGGPPTRGGRR